MTLDVHNPIRSFTRFSAAIKLAPCGFDRPADALTMNDGDIDYSRYTSRELQEALAGIRRDVYPKNYANILAALNALNEHAEVASNQSPVNQASSSTSWVMPIWFPKVYRLALFWFLVVLLIVNSLSLISGHFLALWRIAIQTAIVIGLLDKKRWTRILVYIWSAISVFSGITLWLAILLRGAITESAAHFWVANTGMIAGIFFIIFAKRCLGNDSVRDAQEVEQTSQ